MFLEEKNNIIYLGAVLWTTSVTASNYEIWSPCGSEQAGLG